MRFSFAKTGIPAYQIEPTEVCVDTLFSIVGVNEFDADIHNFVTIFPNPCIENTNIKITAPAIGNITCRIFDLTGKIVFEIEIVANKNKELEIGWVTTENYPGIYFCKVDLFNQNQRKIFSETQKIVVSK